jgi:hypothetical protein
MWAAQAHSAAACKAEVLQEKLEAQRIRREQAEQRRLERQQQNPDTAAPANRPRPLGQGTFGDVFNPDSLRGAPAAPPAAPATPDRGGAGDDFSPGQLRPGTE